MADMAVKTEKMGIKAKCYCYLTLFTLFSQFTTNNKLVEGKYHRLIFPILPTPPMRKIILLFWGFLEVCVNITL
jgi:hypothetical protein